MLARYISHLCLIAIVIFGLKFLLSDDESLIPDEITAIIILCLYGFHSVLLATYTSIAIICTRNQKHLRLGAYSWQLLACTIVTLMMCSMAGMFLYFAKAEVIDRSIGSMLMIGSIIFMIVSLVMLIMTITYLSKLRKTNEA